MANADSDTTSSTDHSTLTVSEDLVPCLPRQQSQTVTLDFNGLLNPPLLLQTDATQCGGQLWPGGMVLAEYLLQEKQIGELTGKTIVELGAGSGLVSLAIALRLRPTEITNNLHITDGLDVLLPLIQQNISVNQANILETTTVVPAKLCWGEPIPNGIPQKPDVVLAADCCYIETSFPLLLRTLENLVGKYSVCYFCYKKRRRADREMVRLLRKAFDVVEVEGRWQREGMFLYEIRRR